MPITDTPLRYPGGKSQLIPFIVELLRENQLFYGEYAEPFAGGAGVAMTLLLKGYVDRIHINDIDPAIHAFWDAVLHHTDELCELVSGSEITIDTWHDQRKFHFEGDVNDVVRLGFSTLFLNRTNRSGILKGGVIGGLAQQGAYKLNCRFNKSDIIRKIKRIALYQEQINLTCLDAVEFVNKVVPTTGPQTLVNLDPPYFSKGPGLYTNFYKENDHEMLSKTVSNISRYWMVTYDDAPEIRQLYAKYSIFFYGINYSAQKKRVGTELMVLDDQLRIPQNLCMPLENISVAAQ